MYCRTADWQKLGQKVGVRCTCNSVQWFNNFEHRLSAYFGQTRNDTAPNNSGILVLATPIYTCLFKYGHLTERTHFQPQRVLTGIAQDRLKWTLTPLPINRHGNRKRASPLEHFSKPASSAPGLQPPLTLPRPRSAAPTGPPPRCAPWPRRRSTPAAVFTVCLPSFSGLPFFKNSGDSGDSRDRPTKT